MINRILQSALLSTVILTNSFSEMQIDENNARRELPLASLFSEKDKLKEKNRETSLWYSRYYDNKVLMEKINDEFEFEDYITKQDEKFYNAIDEMYNKYVNKIYTVSADASFENYNFEENLFPIKILVENQHFDFGWIPSKNSDRYIWPNDTYYLMFSNINSKNNFIQMEKDIAKEFVAKHKKANGEIDRNLLAKYTYKVTGFSHNNFPGANDSPYIEKMNCKVKAKEDYSGNIIREVAYSSENCKSINFIVNADLIKVDIYEKDKKTLIHTITY